MIGSRLISLPFRAAWWLIKTSLKITFFWMYVPYLLIRRLQQPKIEVTTPQSGLVSRRQAKHIGVSSGDLSITARENIENDLINTRGISDDHKEFIKENQRRRRLPKPELILVTLNPDQIRQAKEIHGSRKRITHLLVCGRYGQRFGTYAQCMKSYRTWCTHSFSNVFSKGRETADYDVRDYHTNHIQVDLFPLN